MQEERCPLCLRIRAYDIEQQEYYRFQNSERLICRECGQEIETRLRPTWQIIGKRVFPKSLLE